MPHAADAPTRLDTSGALQLDLDTQRFAGHERIALLRRIDETGSISQAARALGISYKQAWDAVDAMNNLSATPLVQRRTGGRHGGGTRLTVEGRRLITVFETAEREHRRFLERLGEGVRDFDRFHRLLGVINMKVSARNHLHGVVTAVRPGVVNAEVVLDLKGTPLVAIVTNESVETLGLAPGREAYALIKASFVLIATEDGGLHTSARNRLCGTVERLIEGAVNTEVVLALDGGARVTAMITGESARQLELAEGKRACALIKAPHIILAVSD
ncbi:ModE family transcriptional regulator [Marichromatium purpuratum 984]|uniref:ModE family transcriptional regulator n=1 Tax=Marichromatium purpuratum 984 TaxID=765910 RepID=W0E4U6_MARPU|nr:TOBE domain-containing protein [Marichromatium purpuratum]AHF04096.1 ModE family transcriptional regulator [Marichromatium purpuratum 984]